MYVIRYTCNNLREIIKPSWERFDASDTGDLKHCGKRKEKLLTINISSFPRLFFISRVFPIFYFKVLNCTFAVCGKGLTFSLIQRLSGHRCLCSKRVLKTYMPRSPVATQTINPGVVSLNPSSANILSDV